MALFLQPNRVLDGPRTDEAREHERASVQTIYQEVQRGDVVIRKGERVTRDHMLKFVQLGLQHPRVDPLTAVSLAFLAFGLVGLFGFYLYHYHPRLYRDPRSLLLIALISTVALLLFRLGSGALDLRLSGDQTGYAGVMATSVAAMLVAALLNQQVAVVVGVLMSVATALLVGNDEVRDHRAGEQPGGSDLRGQHPRPGLAFCARRWRLARRTWSPSSSRTARPPPTRRHPWGPRWRGGAWVELRRSSSSFRRRHSWSGRSG